MIPIRRALTFASLAVLASAAHADDFSFADWTSTTVNGVDAATTILQTANGPITATLTATQGSYGSLYGGPNDYNVYQPASTWTGDIVGNAPSNPTAANTYYGIQIATANTYTLTFSQPVTNLAYDLWSVGAPGDPVSYDFTQPFKIVAGGPSQEYGGGPLVQDPNNPNDVSGQEGNGTLLFTGTYSSITWNVVNDEYYQVFTIGVQKAQTTPEPAPFAALGLGAVALVRRRRKA